MHWGLARDHALTTRRSSRRATRARFQSRREWRLGRRTSAGPAGLARPNRSFRTWAPVRGTAWSRNSQRLHGNKHCAAARPVASESLSSDLGGVLLPMESCYCHDTQANRFEIKRTRQHFLFHHVQLSTEHILCNEVPFFILGLPQ